jgi:hypothetical protein
VLIPLGLAALTFMMLMYAFKRRGAYVIVASLSAARSRNMIEVAECRNVWRPTGRPLDARTLARRTNLRVQLVPVHVREHERVARLGSEQPPQASSRPRAASSPNAPLGELNVILVSANG